ncbi:DNAH5 [Branchiostoma lanceolatum]|uniref:DNAH5 protein n=1 Tax=Branchiostoma lanceolatum TaxID=7740 RepID=A0A8J9VS49_BRALA|nr:DNAH5 [Branchiostoma lanceolatum]
MRVHSHWTMVSLTDGVETWLQSLQQSIHRTIAKSISRIVRDIGLGVAMEEWAFRYPSQVARLGLLYYWTKECELAVSELKYERKAIPNASKKFSTVINRLPTCLTRGAWKGLDEPFLPIHKLRLQNMITYSLYLRDTLEGLGNRKLRDVTDFEWRRNIRFYMHESGEGSGNHQLCILDGRYEYGCEFLGGRLPLAMTALTERCFLTMSQALTQLKGSAVVGGTGVGKTETVKGMAYLLGRYMAVFACMPQMDTAALGKIIQGLAADGSWGLFDNFHNLNRSGVGVLLEHAQSIYTALRANKHTCHLADGQEVPVDPYVATFITINKDMSRGFELPQEIRALYRNVSLVLPDLGLILRGKVAGLGFKSPKVLADRLRLMADLCRDQLPKEHHHHFSLAALTGVISHAYQKKKIVKEEKQAAMETMSQVSRSNSVISLAIGSQAGFSQTTSTTPKTTRSKSCSYAGPGGPSTFQKVAGTVQHVKAAVKRHSCDSSPKPKVPIIVPQKESEQVTFQKLGKTVQQMTVLSSPSWEISPVATTPPQRQPSAGLSDTNPMSPSPSINVKIGERTRKAGNPNMLTPAAKVEHSMVSDALQECIAPRLKGEDSVFSTKDMYLINDLLLIPQDLVTFTGILKDTFANLPDANQLTQQFSLGVEPAMVHTAQEKGLIPHVPWINKCMSLYKLSQVHKGIIVAGPPASGKSSCIATLVEALSSISAPTPSTRGWGKSAMGTSQKLYHYLIVFRPTGIIVAGPPASGKSSCIATLVEALSSISAPTPSTRGRGKPALGTSHKLLRLNPLVVDDYGLVFGHLNQNHDWVDGIFTHAWRKACRNKSTTWLCLDGPLNPGWADNFSSVLDNENTFHLPNGDRLPLSDNVRLLFETTDLQFASPATISRAGIVYMDKNVLGWRPVAQAWLESRPHQEVINLQRAFNKTLDAVSNFVINEAKAVSLSGSFVRRTKVPVCEVGMFQNCLNLLKAMLDDNVEIGGELHVERLYLFCLIWTFGGLLQGTDRQAFSNLLTSLTSALPDYDHEISVFDYYVDESGEWDPWTSRVQEDTYPDNANISGEVFVETVDTIRCQVLMDYALSSGQNVLLVGPPGSGKTSLINDLIDTQDPATHIVKRLVWSSASEASQLQEFVEANIHHRQGFVYGAKDYKGFQIFIDDINMPARDEFGVQRVNENLRELLDHHILLKLQKPFEWRTVEGLSVLATLTLHEYPSTSTQLLSERLIRHFSVVHLPAPQGQDLESVVNSMLEANMSFDGQGLDTELHNSLTAASCELLTTVQDVLRPSPMPGRQHYMFTLRNIAKAFQCMKRLTSESRADEKMVVGLWRHEVWHIMENSICRRSDQNWFNHNLQEILKKHFPTIEIETLPPHFVTFPIDGRAYQRPVTTMSTDKKIRVALQAITSMKEVQETLASHLASYNERFRNEQLDVLLCEYVFQHIARVHRVLSFQNGGNLLMIGAIGSHLVTMVKLALHIADMDMYHVDCSRANTFFDGLRSAVRMTGSEGKMLTLLFTAKDLHDESYLDAINSLLVCGEYPPLFSNDELEGLLQVLGPAMKKAYAHLMSNPMKFFVSRVKSNLKIVICLPPRHRLLRVAASQYPGLLTSCQVNWVCAWTQECLLDKANYFVEKYNMVSDNQEMRDKLVTVMANIHSYVLQDCRQIPWAGNMEETVSLTMCKRDSKKDQYKTQMLELPNLPYSKSIMHERILLQHKGDSKVSHRSIPMGPTIYRRFMECFLHILSTKTAQQNANITRLKKALSTLSQTREDAKLMEEKIKVVQADYEEAQKKTAGLLRQLTGKATTLEKLKAQLGGEGSLGAYLQLNEVSSEEEEEDDLLKQDDIGEDSDAIEVLMASYIRSTRVMEEYSTIKHRQYRSHWKSHDRDEYDDEFDRMRKENMKSRKLQVVEELAAAKKAVEDAKKALEGSRKKVLQWRESVSRQCVERIRAFQNPPVLVALVMDMMMTLLGRRKIPKQDTGEEKEGKNSQTDRTSSASSLSFKPLVKRESKRQESSRHGSTGTKEGDKVDRNEWKKLQHAMSDSVKFVEMVHRVPWQDGLHPDILAAVQGYLASSKNGDAGPTGEGSLLEAGMSASTLVSPRRSGGSSPPGLTIAGVRYSSEDAAVLLQYTIAIVEYTQLCGPLQIAKERLQNLQDEIEESERLEKKQEVEVSKKDEPEEPQISLLDHVEEEEEELGPNDLPIIQGEVDRLQEEFDEAVMEKHRLENELHNCHERLRAATETIKSLREQELLWQQSVEENSSNDLLLSNCITAAAFLTYCGPMGLDGRNSMYEFFLHVCEHYGLPIPNKMLYRDVPLVNFLYTDVQIKHLELQGLPTNPVALDSSCFVTETLSNNSWVLLCDPTSRAIPWLTDYLKEGFIIAKYHDLKSQLETCLTEGLFLILTDIDLHVLAKDNRFNHVFRRRMSFLTGKAPFKIIVGSHEVECRPGFRLYMHTTCMPHEVPEEVAAYTSMVNFYQDRSGTEAELLDRFIRLEKTRVQDERTNLAQEKISNMERLALLEDQMLNLLASDTRLLNNLAVTKKLADMKKQFDETQYSQQKIEVSEAAIRRNCEQFRTIATRAAVLFDASRHMREINSCYQISFDQFLAVFDAAIKHSERYG